MEYQGPERRKEALEFPEIRQKLNSVGTRLEVLITSVDGLKESKDKAHNEIYHILKLHDAEIFGRGEEEGIKQKIGKIGDMTKSLGDHTVRDNWLFGVVITMLLAIFVGIFIK